MHSSLRRRSRRAAASPVACPVSTGRAMVRPGRVGEVQCPLPAGPPPFLRHPLLRAHRRGSVYSRWSLGTRAPPRGRDERVTKRRNRRVRFRPQSVDELDPNIRRGIEMRLRLIEEVVFGPHVSWFCAPGKDEAMKRIMRALARGDRKAEEEAAEDYMRAELMEWWRIFPEQQLLKDLYGRAARRSERRGFRDSRRRPDHKEGLQLPRQCWPTSRASAGWTVRGSPQPCRRFWRPRPHRAYSPPACCQSTSPRRG